MRGPSGSRRLVLLVGAGLWLAAAEDGCLRQGLIEEVVIGGAGGVGDSGFAGASEPGTVYGEDCTLSAAQPEATCVHCAVTEDLVHCCREMICSLRQGEPACRAADDRVFVRTGPGFRGEGGATAENGCLGVLDDWAE